MGRWGVRGRLRGAIAMHRRCVVGNPRREVVEEIRRWRSPLLVGRRRLRGAMSRLPIHRRRILRNPLVEIVEEVRWRQGSRRRRGGRGVFRRRRPRIVRGGFAYGYGPLGQCLPHALGRGRLAPLARGTGRSIRLVDRVQFMGHAMELAANTFHVVISAIARGFGLKNDFSGRQSKLPMISLFVFLRWRRFLFVYECLPTSLCAPKLGVLNK